MNEQLYSELILAKIKTLKKDIQLTKRETEQAFYDSLEPHNLFNNKYFYIVSGGLLSFIFRKKIPKSIKTLLNLFILRYPVKKMFRKQRKKG